MIAYISGKALSVEAGKCLVVTDSGIGYDVFTHKLSRLGEVVELFIAHIIRENSQSLFGFASLKEKELFEMLLGVNGVGPKSAFSLVGLGAENIRQAIILDQTKVLKSAPGIGAKAASKIILELKDKLAKSMSFKMPAASLDNNPGVINSDILTEALKASEELGFSQESTLRIAKSLMESKEYNQSEDLLKDILRNR